LIDFIYFIVEVFLCNFDFMPELFQVVFDDRGIDEFVIFGDSASPLFIGEMLLKVEILDSVELDLF
jgi:hypothetical protein